MAQSLDKITIRGFKSIRALENFELSNLNVLIGANGAGKSNIIEFFRMLRSMIDGNLYEYIRSGGGISDFLFNGRKVTSQLEFEMRFGVRGYRFNITPGPPRVVRLRMRPATMNMEGPGGGDWATALTETLCW